MPASRRSFSRCHRRSTHYKRSERRSHHGLYHHSDQVQKPLHIIDYIKYPLPDHFLRETHLLRLWTFYIHGVLPDSDEQKLFDKFYPNIWMEHRENNGGMLVLVKSAQNTQSILTTMRVTIELEKNETLTYFLYDKPCDT